jgi:hypothetical protein
MWVRVEGLDCGREEEWCGEIAFDSVVFVDIVREKGKEVVI